LQSIVVSNRALKLDMAIAQLARGSDQLNLKAIRGGPQQFDSDGADNALNACSRVMHGEDRDIDEQPPAPALRFRLDAQRRNALAGVFHPSLVVANGEQLEKMQPHRFPHHKKIKFEG